MLTRRNKRRARHRLAVIAVTSTAALWTYSPAMAAPPEIRAANWAGYVLTGNFHSITAQWIEPEVSCTDAGVIQRVSPWIGFNGSDVGGRTALPLMHTGTAATCVSDAGMLAAMPGLTVETYADGTGAEDRGPFHRLMQVSEGMNATFGQVADGICRASGTGSAGPSGICTATVERSVWWDAYPAGPVAYDDVTSAPGDSMHASVTYDGTAYTMTLMNLTRRWVRTTVQPSDAPALTAEIVIEGQLNNALPGFTPVTFTNIAVDGKPLSAHQPVAYSIEAMNGLLTPGPIAADGTGFTLAR